MAGVAVGSVGRRQQVALLGARRHSRGRAGALDVPQHGGDFREVGEPQKLRHQRHARAAGGREGAGAVPAGADDDAHRREFVFGLQDGVVARAVLSHAQLVAVALECFRQRRGGRDRIPGADRGPAVERAEGGCGIAVHQNPVADRLRVARLDGQRAVQIVEGVVAADFQGVDVGGDEVVLALVLGGDHAGDDLEVDADERRHRAQVDDVLEQRPMLGVRKLRQHQLRRGHADVVDVRTAQPWRDLLAVVVHQVAAGHDRVDVLGEGLGVHGHHDVHALAPPEVALLGHPHLEPSGQPLDVGRKDVPRRNRNAHAEQRLGEHPIGGCGTRAVDVGEADDEIVEGGHDERSCPGSGLA